LKKHFLKSVINKNSKIKFAIKNLSESNLQICFICENEKLIGTLTDGDVRRAILKGIKLDEKVSNIMNKKYFYLRENETYEKAKRFMDIYKIKQIPLIDRSKKLCNVFFSETIGSSNIIDNPFLIMAGGFGKRLYPRTKNCPKPLLPLAGKPILEHIINKIRNEGFREIVISTHYLSEMIVEYFGNGKQFGVDISYIKENKPLGTSGAISKFKNVKNKSFIVCNGDVLTDISFNQLLEHHLSNKAKATMAVRKYSWQNPFGVIKTNGINITKITEKPVAETYVNAGIYVFSPDVKNFVTSNKKLEMPDLFRTLRKKKLRTIVFPMFENWLDIGNSNEYEKAQKRLFKKV